MRFFEIIRRCHNLSVFSLYDIFSDFFILTYFALQMCYGFKIFLKSTDLAAYIEMTGAIEADRTLKTICFSAIL